VRAGRNDEDVPIGIEGEVIAVLLFVVMLIVVTIIWMVAILPRAAGLPGATGKGSPPTGAPPDVEPASDPRPASLEGVLVRRLASGDITREQYLREMAHLAERDAERHPLEAPFE
jgi:hypothetical protein